MMRQKTLQDAPQSKPKLSVAAEPADQYDVSVVIPALNEQRHVTAALASVAAQSWPLERLEALVVDNGSSDATAEMVRAFAAAAPRLAVRLVNEPCRGTARARNRGAALATGRWLVFLDADSRLAPDLVARVVERGRRGEPAGSIRLIADTADGADRIDRAFFNLLEFGKVLFKIRAQMFYCERSRFQEIGGFDEQIQVAEDRELLVRLERAGTPLGHLNESWIATSPRRLHRHPLRLGLLATFARWAMAQAGLGRRWRY